MPSLKAKKLEMLTQEKVVLELTFRTLCRTSEAILEEPLVEGGLGAISRLFHAL
jgi:hypothetical protein